MFKQIIALVLLLPFAAQLWAESDLLVPEGWEVGSGYQYNMSLYAQVLDFDGQRVESRGSMLGVFDATGECRGVAAVEEGPCGMWYQVIISSNSAAESGLVMKFLDATAGEVYAIRENIDFQADSTIPGENYTQEPFALHYKPLTVDLTIELVQNWNWISFNVQQGERELLEFLADYTGKATDGDIIKGQRGQATFSGGQWYPSPGDFKLEPGKMYKLRKQAAGTCTLTVTGSPCTGDEAIAVVAGWNWLGYTGEKAATVNGIFKAEGFAENDLIKPQVGKQATFSGGKWYGNLVFTPGCGYMLKQSAGGTVDFRNAVENEVK